MCCVSLITCQSKKHNLEYSADHCHYPHCFTDDFLYNCLHNAMAFQRVDKCLFQHKKKTHMILSVGFACLSTLFIVWSLVINVSRSRVDLPRSVIFVLGFSFLRDIPFAFLVMVTILIFLKQRAMRI